MRLTLEEKLKMVKEHEIEGKSISHVSEKYDNYSISNLKYLIQLYRHSGEKVFLDRSKRKYQRDTKLLAIKRVESGESARSVSIDLELVDPCIVRDWIKLYKAKGSEAIKDSCARGNYLTKDIRAKQIVDKTLLEENKRLKAEIEYLKKSRSLTQKLSNVTNKEKAKIVTELRNEFDLEVLLKITNLPSSTYYYHLNLKGKIKPDKYKEIRDKIDYLYIEKHKKRMGYFRIYLELKNEGYCIGKNKVLEIMRNKDYIKTRRKKWRKYNSYQGSIGKIPPNILDRNFKTNKIYEKAGTDVTMFPLKSGSVYLSPIIDFHSREILAYSVGKNAKMEKIQNMLSDLCKNHEFSINGMILQSDQGVQYQNSRYNEILKNLGIVQSMSRKGNCLDNSPTENFFGRMKTEMWYGHEKEFKSSKDLIEAIHEYIWYYNNVRIVTKLKMSPIEYRTHFNN